MPIALPSAESVPGVGRFGINPALPPAPKLEPKHIQQYQMETNIVMPEYPAQHPIPNQVHRPTGLVAIHQAEYPAQSSVAQSTVTGLAPIQTPTHPTTCSTRHLPQDLQQHTGHCPLPPHEHLLDAHPFFEPLPAPYPLQPLPAPDPIQPHAHPPGPYPIQPHEHPPGPYPGQPPLRREDLHQFQPPPPQQLTQPTAYCPGPARPDIQLTASYRNLYNGLQMTKLRLPAPRRPPRPPSP
ncbi:hypothetical protein TWF730_007209 [Orbilia blumenaviensis]|uniref:Uncharacterized protein n=1 Tax=Orbilia blumenaviensis TaxID=1796055 RepID=A0AAV9V7B4_9PEZI